jgi:hypothetical protein
MIHVSWIVNFLYGVHFWFVSHEIIARLLVDYEVLHGLFRPRGLWILHVELILSI